MASVYKDNNGKVILAGGKAISATKSRNEFGNTGTVDTAGLTALGWDTEDIAWLQKVCWWDAEDDEKWKVSEANKAKGALITWSNYQSYSTDADIVFFPKLSSPNNGSYLFSGFTLVYAIPTHGWTFSGVNINRCMNGLNQCFSVGDIASCIGTFPSDDTMFSNNYCIRTYGTFTSAAGGKISGSFYNCYNLRQLLGMHLGSMESSGIGFLQNNYTLTDLDMPKMVNYRDHFKNLYSLRNIRHSAVISASISLGNSLLLTRDSCLVLFNALDPNNPGTITLHANAKARLSDADKAIATDKGWTIA